MTTLTEESFSAELVKSLAKVFDLPLLGERGVLGSTGLAPSSGGYSVEAFKSIQLLNAPARVFLGVL